MAIRQAKNRYVMLLNALRDAAGTNPIWTPTEDEGGNITGGSGKTGQQENSLFYMGFSKNFNTVVSATRYPISDKAVDGVTGETNPNTNGGYGCCVEFKGYDSGFHGPMPSQKVSLDTTYDRSWLTTIVGQSQKIGVFPVNIALHTYVDNDYVASHALAQAWLLRDANKINGGYIDKLSSANYSGFRGNDGPSGTSRSYEGNWFPCVYKHIHNKHIKNEAFGLNPGGVNENRILYNSICSLRKNAYFRAYGDDMGWSNGKRTWWAARSNFQGVNACNCMNYYDYSYEMPWWKSKRCDNRWLVTTAECQTKSYGGGYVSLHHLHFTTYGNTSSKNPENGNYIEDGQYKNMYFYIPNSTGEGATQIPLESGYYESSTNTTHYWVYFYDNRYTDRSVYNDNYVESGWSYDSPINVPVGKVYSKITPVACYKSNQLPAEGQSNTFAQEYTCTADRNSIGAVYINDGSHSSPVHYIASFTTSFNIYLVCKSESEGVVSSRGAKSRVLGAGESTPNFRFEEEKDGFNQLIVGQETIDIKDDIPIQEQQDEDKDMDNDLTKSIAEPAGVQICSISGVLVDNTWAFSHVKDAFWNLEYARHLAPYIRVHHHTCIGYWGEWLDTPKMHGLLLLQHCCSDGNTRYFSTNLNASTPPDELTHSMYCPGNISNTTSNVYVVSSHEENSFVLNNGNKVSNVVKDGNNWTSKFANPDDVRWLKSNGNFISVYNIIKVANNNAKLKMPTSDDCTLSSPTAHNRGLYTSCTENQTGIVQELNGTPVKIFKDEDENSTNTAGDELTQEWMKNHYRPSSENPNKGSVADCGVDFINKNGNYFIRTYQTNRSNGQLVNKVEKIVDETPAGENEELNSKNADFVVGRLGSIPSYVRKYRAKFSIVKDSVRINGISLNKMASKFPLEARTKEIPNIITFKLRVDFRYYYANNENKPKLDESGRLQYWTQLPQYTDAEEQILNPEYGEWKDCIYTAGGTGGNGKKLASSSDPGYGNKDNIWYIKDFIPEIFDSDPDSEGKPYGIGNQTPIIPFYKLYNDDLFIDSVGTTRDIILPAKYSKDFPYYNISLRLPLTAIDSEFCSKIGNNKFIGANCYDISDQSTTYEYINEEGVIFNIPNNSDSSTYEYQIQRVKSSFNPEHASNTTVEYVRATEEELNDPNINVDSEGYLLDDNGEKIPESISSSNYTDDEQEIPGTGSTAAIVDSSDAVSYEIEDASCNLYGIQSPDCPLKGIKYEFKILKSEIESNSREVLTCFLRFWNDSDTFGFLDFSFKFPKFCYDVDGNGDITGNEMDAYTVEGSTTLSSLLSKIIIKGVEIDNNEILFNDASFETTLKKVLNSAVSNSLPNNQAAAEDTPATIELVTSPEISNNGDLKGAGDISGIANTENDAQKIISSEKDGVMNIGQASDQTEVLTDPEYFAILNRNTGEIIGVGNESEINYNEYGRFIESYIDRTDPLGVKGKKAGQDSSLGMKQIENRCLSRNILPILSNKIVVY